jgi:hypothetical protein
VKKKPDIGLWPSTIAEGKVVCRNVLIGLPIGPTPSALEEKEACGKRVRVAEGNGKEKAEGGSIKLL